MIRRGKKSRLIVCLLAAAACLLILDARAADDLTRPLKASPDGHFLMQPDGEPFFWLADTGWDLFQTPTREEVDQYLKNRADKGFTVIQAVIGGAARHQGPNRYGDLPFVEADPTRPDDRYFAHVDWVIERARRYGLRMAIVPYWGAVIHDRSGILGGPPTPIPIVFNEQNAEVYARWLGRRYRNAGIAWMFGGDTNPIWPKFLSFRIKGNVNGSGGIALARDESDMSARDWRPLYDAMAKGMAEGEGQAPFITYHPTCCTFAGMPQPLTSEFFGDRQWLTMNMIQSSHYENPPETVHGPLIGYSTGWQGPQNYLPIARSFASIPARPVIDGEPRYEDTGKDNDAENVGKKGYWAGYDARNAAYHAVFAGAAGHAYGNHAVWQFADSKLNKVDPPILPGLTWREALQRPVAGQLRHLKMLLLSRPYFTRMPDQSLIVGQAGHGTAHIGATRDAQGRYAMIYLPHGQPVSVDLSGFAGRLTAWWFDPRSGSASRIAGSFGSQKPQSFTPPSSGPEVDWVLVLDESNQRFAPPGHL